MIPPKVNNMINLTMTHAGARCGQRRNLMMMARSLCAATTRRKGARGRAERDAAMRGLALEIAGEMQGWTGAGRFVDELDTDGVLTLLTWLWLWDTVYNQTYPYELMEVRDRERLAQCLQEQERGNVGR